MDPLSITASVITVVTLTGQLISLGYSYGVGVSGCPQELRDLTTELISFSTILGAVRSVLDPTQNPTAGPHPTLIGNSLQNNLDECATQLGKLLLFLQKYQDPADGKVKKVVKRMMWPLKEQETKEWIARIEGYKSTFSLALSTDGLHLSRVISVNVLELKKDQEEERRLAVLKRKGCYPGEFSPLCFLIVRVVTAGDKFLKTLNWLSPADRWRNYDAACMLRNPGTGGWVTERDGFKEWLKKDNSMLWIHGIRASSIPLLLSGISSRRLTSATTSWLRKNHPIDEIEQTDTELIYYYFDFKEATKQTSRDLYGNLISQLLENDSEVSPEVERLHDDANGNPPQLDDLKEALIKLLAARPKTIIVIDALDECQDRSEILDSLLKLHEPASGKVNLLITSRQEEDIKRAFSGFPNIAIKPADIKDDIKKFITTEMERQPKLRRLPPHMKAEIMNALSIGADGVFRWAKHSLERVARQRTNKAIRSTLHALSRNMDQTYELALTKIPPEDAILAQRILQWLVCSFRPLTLEELVEAIAIDPGACTLDRTTLLNDPEDIKEICAGLASLGDDGKTVGLAHFSVKEYLISPQIASSPTAAPFRIDLQETHVLLAKRCLTYLSFEDFELGPTRDEAEFEKRVEDHPFLRYASQNWPLHALRYSPDRDDVEFLALANGFLNPSAVGENLLAWAQARHVEEVGVAGKWDGYLDCEVVKVLLKKEKQEIEALIKDPWALAGCECFGGGGSGGGRVAI
ncbi:unnamed protein product [Tuber aestivum]|uniref:NACHT domain-containing protein n=1 Tax=Tuber aestivum TaxID=59557 RepID=A0A292PKS9_9PEZI|nr:unnamed protein product [Tuber aestivum]